MTVKELKKVLEKAPDDNEVMICVNEPAGYSCPDGATVEIKKVIPRGIDWHDQHTLIVPFNALDVHNVDKWFNGIGDDGKRRYPSIGDKFDENPSKKEVFMNGMTAEEYIKMLNAAHEASKGSKLVFK